MPEDAAGAAPVNVRVVISDDVSRRVPGGLAVKIFPVPASAAIDEPMPEDAASRSPVDVRVVNPYDVRSRVPGDLAVEILLVPASAAIEPMSQGLVSNSRVDVCVVRSYHVSSGPVEACYVDRLLNWIRRFWLLIWARGITNSLDLNVETVDTTKILVFSIFQIKNTEASPGGLVRNQSLR